ncbi:Versicolorin B synthase [Cladorrhinum sp. PSN332]|nr:Versicolorin B synthase [Cladorrhinum sp. PSN332]
MASTPDLTQPFDYIVVGGGTAGLVVANRLSEDSNVSVLVIEAGGDRRADPAVVVPGLVAGTYGNDLYDWNFSSPPQPTLNNRTVAQARGKMLGGSSALNFMMLLYPTKGNIDSWAALGNKGWDYNSMAPYFEKFATVYSPPQSAKDLLGLTYLNESLANGDGPIDVSMSEGYGITNKAWFDTFKAEGLEVASDPRQGRALGAFQNYATINPVNHTRSHAATGYYTPQVAQRPNLVVVTETLVKKILFDTASGPEPVATGVEILTKDNQQQQVSANIEVILAAGALQSPQILELSGVGGRALLEQHSIPVVLDNPNVGTNVQDHPIVCQSFEVGPETPSGDIMRDPAVLQALIDLYLSSGGEGPLGQSTISVAYAPLVDDSGILSAQDKAALLGPYYSSNASSSDAAAQRILDLISDPDEPAFQYLLFPSQITIPQNPSSMAEYITPSLPDNYLTVMTILNHPLSRGTVHISSPDVRDMPVWDPKYNSHPLDMELLARAVQFVDKRLARPDSPFGKVLKEGGKRILGEPPAAVAAEDSLESAREVVRRRQISVFHVAGSLAMMPRDKGGVVDERLRLHGVGRLRVVDASVFPLEPVGNIQSCVYAVAEKAADLIKEDNRL